MSPDLQTLGVAFSFETWTHKVPKTSTRPGVVRCFASLLWVSYNLLCGAIALIHQIDIDNRSRRSSLFWVTLGNPCCVQSISMLALRHPATSAMSRHRGFAPHVFVAKKLTATAATGMLHLRCVAFRPNVGGNLGNVALPRINGSMDQSWIIWIMCQLWVDESEVNWRREWTVSKFDKCIWGTWQNT